MARAKSSFFTISTTLTLTCVRALLAAIYWLRVIVLGLFTKQLRWKSNITLGFARRWLVLGLWLIVLIIALLLWRLLAWLVNRLRMSRDQVLRWAWLHISPIKIGVVALVISLVVLVLITTLATVKPTLLVLVLVLMLILVLLAFEARIDNAVVVISVLKVILSKNAVALR